MSAPRRPSRRSASWFRGFSMFRATVPGPGADKMPRWYVVHTPPQSEARAKANLERQGYEVYLPRCRKWRRHARRADIVAAPLFPRYLFLRLDISCDRWRPVLSTFGVCAFVCYGGVTAPVPVRIMGGPFADHGARFE